MFFFIIKTSINFNEKFVIVPMTMICYLIRCLIVLLLMFPTMSRAFTLMFPTMSRAVTRMIPTRRRAFTLMIPMIRWAFTLMISMMRRAFTLPRHQRGRSQSAPYLKEQAEADPLVILDVSLLPIRLGHLNARMCNLNTLSFWESWGYRVGGMYPAVGVDDIFRDFLCMYTINRVTNVLTSRYY